MLFTDSLKILLNGDTFSAEENSWSLGSVIGVAFQTVTLMLDIWIDKNKLLLLKVGCLCRVCCLR
jgi:hypothetical protein